MNTTVYCGADAKVLWLGGDRTTEDFDEWGFIRISVRQFWYSLLIPFLVTACHCQVSANSLSLEIESSRIENKK